MLYHPSENQLILFRMSIRRALYVNQWAAGAERRALAGFLSFVETSEDA